MHRPPSRAPSDSDQRRELPDVPSRASRLLPRTPFGGAAPTGLLLAREAFRARRRPGRGRRQGGLAARRGEALRGEALRGERTGRDCASRSSSQRLPRPPSSAGRLGRVAEPSAGRAAHGSGPGAACVTAAAPRPALRPRGGALSVAAAPRPRR